MVPLAPAVHLSRCLLSNPFKWKNYAAENRLLLQFLTLAVFLVVGDLLVVALLAVVAAVSDWHNNHLLHRLRQDLGRAHFQPHIQLQLLALFLHQPW